MRKHSRKETNHRTEEREAKKPWLAHQGRETDYLSGKDPPEEERLQRTSWLATAEVPKGRADTRQTLRRGEACGGSRGNQGRKVGRVEPSDGKGTLEQSPEAPEGPETRGEEARKDEDQGRTEIDGQEKKQTERLQQPQPTEKTRPKGRTPSRRN